MVVNFAPRLPGDVGFDPLRLAKINFAVSPRSEAEILRDYRESELKHGRLAMLAAMIPTERVPYVMIETSGLSGPLDALNGDTLILLGPMTLLIAYFGWIVAETYGMCRKSSGDLGLRFFIRDDVDLEWKKEVEIWMTRIAMVAFYF